ncbi:hypothetical protein [Demequina aurantiaca]|uniref:hypothetical protein n=1 Tax=Demequina aurantiaca TaxID=676200 RepID=UPI003D32E228
MTMGGAALYSQTRTLRWGSSLLIAALVAMTLTATVAAGPAAAASPSVAVEITGADELLAGETSTFTVSASNPSASDDGFNLGVYVDVPVGVAFVSSGMGTPVIYDSASDITPPLAAGTVRWVWEDVSDLPATGVFSDTVTVSPNPVTFPVGSSFTVTGNAALSGDPTYLPVFGGSTGSGGQGAQDATVLATPAPFTTDLISLEVTKSEPSPESELLRGVHDQTTVYSITVRNTSEGPNNDTVLVDYLPAGLEFLGCGEVDNSLPATGSSEAYDPEYDGAPSLAGTAAVPADCDVPASVTTIVADATLAADHGLDEGSVYTRVQWDLGTLAGSAERTVSYAAGIPLSENTMEFLDGDGSSYTPDATGQQASNLDNNSGASTRQGGESTPQDGYGLTNVAVATSTFDGPVSSGTSRDISASGSNTVTAMDLAVVKSITSPADAIFEVGEVTTYTLTMRTSEYMDASEIVLTDTIPNGLCPLLPSGSGSGCDAPGSVTNGAIDSATANPDGSHTLVLIPTSGALAANSQLSLTYQALNRDSYVTGGDLNPTTSGDGFTNEVEITGTTNGVAALASTSPALDPSYIDPLLVTDDSASTLSTDHTTISKRVMPRDEVQTDLGAGVDPCTAGTFPEILEGAPAEPDFRMGDTVCFELRVNFPSSIDARNPIAADFLPAGLSYVGQAITAESTAVIASSTATTSRFSWELGTAGADGDLYVERGAVFVAHVWATVVEPSNGEELDKAANLMKYRQENVDGDLFFLRDEAAIEVTPELQLVKGVQSIEPVVGATTSTRDAQSEDNGDGTVFGSNRDGIEVTEGEEVTYRVDLSGAPFEVSNVTVWDLLPVGISKADVSDYTGAVVYDPSDSGQPGYPSGLSTADKTRSVIVWTGTTVPVGGATLNYVVTIPTPTSVGTALENTASIINYSAGINSSTTETQEYIPAGSLNADPAVTPNTDGAGTRDDSDVFLPSPSIIKERTSPEADNNKLNEVVPGEYATFTYAVTIPAHTSVFGATLSDAFVGSGNWSIGTNNPATATLDGGALPAGFTLDVSNGTLTFPAEYTNATANAQVFEVTLEAAIESTSDWTHSPGTARRDTATFAGTGFSSLSDNANVRLIEPDPAVTKTVDQETVTAGQTVEYTLTANNTEGRPTSFDTVVTDCVPTGLANVTVSEPLTGVVVDPNPAPGGCEGTLITWTIGDLEGDAETELNPTLKYTASVGTDAAGGEEYVNTATITGYSLKVDDAVPAPAGAGRREYTRDDDATVMVLGESLTKTVDEDTATIGEARYYTLTLDIPADVNFYDAAIIDDVPAGMSIDDVTFTCEYADVSDCLSTLEAPGTALTPSGTLHGWWMGDVLADPLERTITVKYRGTVLNDELSDETPVNEAGDILTNTANGVWNSTSVLDTQPEDAGYPHDLQTDDADAVVTVVEPAIEIAKSVNDEDSDTVEPGTPFSYKLTVTNSGDSDAHSVTVKDAVPTGVKVSSISDGGSITGSDPVTGGGTIEWTLPVVANGTPKELTYEGTFAASINLADAALTNNADVPTYYSLPAGNDERREYTEDPKADAVVTPLFPGPVVTKAPTGAVAYIGEAHTFTLELKNEGNGTGTNVTLEDVLPAGFAYVAGSAVITPGDDLDPDVTSQTLTWSTLDDIAAGATTTITYQAVPSETYDWDATNTGAGISHTNSATLTMDDTSDAPANAAGTFVDDAEAAVSIHRADLSVQKSHDPDTDPVAGAEHTWTVTVTNAEGSDPAVGPIVIQDTLPAGVTFESIVDEDEWTVTGPVAGLLTLTYDGADPLAAGDSLSVDITVTFADDASQGDSATNTACADSRTFETVTDNNCDTDEDTIEVLADLELTKNATSTGYVAGEQIEWQLDVTNNGPSVSRSPITITDTLPTTVEWDTVSGSGTDWLCDAVDLLTGTFSCTWTSATPLGVGDDLPALTLDAIVKSSTTTNVTNSATVFPTTEDPDTDNNTDFATTGGVDSEADLGIVKSIALDADDAPIDLVAGGSGRYRLTVTNNGPSDALGVVVQDTLPTGLSYAGGVTSSSGDTWVCLEDSGDAQLVNCELTSGLGTLVADDSTWLEFDVTVDSDVTGTVENSATVGSDTEDVHPDNNTDTIQTDPFVQTNVQLAKTHDSDVVYRVGDEVTFTLTVTNSGNADASDVVITDAIPAGTTYVGLENADGWTATGPDAGGILTLTLDDPLPAGASNSTASVDVVLELTTDAVPTVTNVADVTTSTDETSSEDNQATDQVTVASPDLEITKSASEPVVKGDEVFAYTLQVLNADAAAYADDVTVIDVLDEDLALVTDPADIGGADWACELTGADGDGFGGTLTCELDTLAAGAAATAITFDVRVSTDISKDQIPNTATVASDDEHPTNVDGSNSDTADVNALWIDFSGESICRADVPVMDYTLDAHNSASGLPVTLTWYADTDGDQVADGPAISVQTLNDPTAAGEQTGSVLWPGAAVDQNGVGIAWPGWRTVEAGETPVWQNQIADPTLATYPLREGALVTVTVNAQTTVVHDFPPMSSETPGCETPRPVLLDIDKSIDSSTAIRGESVTYTLAVTNTGYGATDGVVLTDPIASNLRVTDVSPELSTDPTVANWRECTVTGTDSDGFGGVVTCELDGWFGYGQTAPDVLITAQTLDEGGPRVTTNVATVTWTDPYSPATPTQSLSDDASLGVVLTPAQILAMTGISPAGMLWAMLGLLGAGGALLLIRRHHSG